MIRHLPMLLVASLFVGGCHRNKPASKAVRANTPVRASSPKEIKPAKISITPPVPTSKPVVVPVVKKEQSIAQDKEGAGLKAQGKPVASASVSSKRPEQTKKAQSPIFSAPVSKSGGVSEDQAREAVKEGTKPQVGATAEARMPWERPLYEPASSRVQKVKSEDSSKIQGERPKQSSADEVQNQVRETKPLATPPTAKSSAPEVVSQEAPSNTETPAAATQEAAKVGETTIETTTNQPKDVVSRPSTGATAESPKLASKKSSRSQSAPTSTLSPPEAESKRSQEHSAKKAEEASVVVEAATLRKPMEPTPAIEASAQSASRLSGAAPSAAQVERDSSLGSGVTIKSSGEVARDFTDAQKTTAVAPKKLSDAERKEAVRKQANESYHSGQQLIRESRNAEAMQALKQTVKLAPESADAWLRIAYLLEREGKLDEARRAFKEAKKFWSF